MRDILMSNKMTLNDMQGLDAAATEARMRLAQTLIGYHLLLFLPAAFPVLPAAFIHAAYARQYPLFFQ